MSTVSQAGTLYAGQVPRLPMRVAVVDPDSGEPIDLTLYDDVVPTLTDPLGVPVDVSGASTPFDTDGVDGVYLFVWPTGSLFETVGDYSFQTRLVASGVLDYTDVAVIEVFAPLEEAV